MSSIPTSVQAVPRISMGGLPIAVMNREETAAFLVDAALAARGRDVAPLIVSSANGQVLSLCASDPKIKNLYLSSDLISADGMSLVHVSKLRAQTPLPERVATTDLFHDVAREAQRKGARFFMLGASQGNISKAVTNVRTMYPDLEVVGFRNGYFSLYEEAIVDQINKSGADILWVSMGVPRQLEFAMRWRPQLKVGVLKTSGGLFDFLSGRDSRAPQWMQDAGLEWLYRLGLEPRRLFWRYAVTNIHATYLLFSMPVAVLPACDAEPD
ncbi:hypothetical protein AUC68_14715 [Methyloceanibacter methanicus]|uniref:UDP-hexose transferase n=1 Tax=Methyloceanibacter methanicus TaxID=1774968 RepID=A0A1E3W481_9HYPH|nr:WecB/TagA/CpsF family glycosyltransferase [Methyloceanibacter methanicus]ODS00618.1 hypothetical protein AUC68_14715 [Methyloceanibacter methanicus]